MDDAKAYGDEGTHTLAHIWEHCPTLRIPHLRSLGLGNVCGKEDTTKGYYMKLKEYSVGKDTMTGHWEMMGLSIQEPFQTFSENGFPKELIEALEKECQRKFVGNKAASGTEILDEYAEREIKSGELILYTSADSVLQICAHEKHTGLDVLYSCCEKARELTMKAEWKVGRIIARPYVGECKGQFKRTPNRHDYALKPFQPTILNMLKDNGYDVVGIGKISDIFAKEGITQSQTSQSSVHGMQQTIDMLNTSFRGLCFTNLVDFDALWGHRRNPVGYAKELEKFDKQLGVLLASLKEDDLLMISADHGNDPTHTGSDHTREKVPLLCYSKKMKNTKGLEDQSSFATIGATIADNFDLNMQEGMIGESILQQFK